MPACEEIRKETGGEQPPLASALSLSPAVSEPRTPGGLSPNACDELSRQNILAYMRGSMQPRSARPPGLVVDEPLVGPPDERPEPGRRTGANIVASASKTGTSERYRQLTPSADKMVAEAADLEMCTICFEAPQPGAEVCTLLCGHGYCHACIKEWWAQPGPKTCPTCRKCFAGLRGCVVTTVPAAPGGLRAQWSKI